MDAATFNVTPAGVPSAIYYARPPHRRTAYSNFPATELLVSDMLSERVLSLPMYPYLARESQDHVIRGLRSALNVAV